MLVFAISTTSCWRLHAVKFTAAVSRLSLASEGCQLQLYINALGAPAATLFFLRCRVRQPPHKTQKGNFNPPTITHGIRLDGVGDADPAVPKAAQAPKNSARHPSARCPRTPHSAFRTPQFAMEVQERRSSLSLSPDDVADDLKEALQLSNQDEAQPLAAQDEAARRETLRTLRLAFVGNVDSGKSSLIGTLIKGELDDGRVVEFDSPHNLVKDGSGVFYELAKEGGYLDKLV
ncbi:hypothetical protein ON010_g8113 [Phytophthora cinnamomi]|nr:hypothetical protein ON010_g8113 [Phytophthora cinnamomi]